MPFIEIKRNPAESIVRVRSGGFTVVKDIRDKYFVDKKVRIFYDDENLLLGLEPSNEGYIMSEFGFVRCTKLSKSVEAGEYPAAWSDEHKMVVVKINPRP